MLNNITTDFETMDVAITGKMVQVRATLDESLIQMQGGALPEKDRRYIREQLAMQLAGFLLDNNMIEYTYMKDPMDFKTRINGRIFVTPNGDTKLIRTLKR
jgi:hypothetical protein